MALQVQNRLANTSESWSCTTMFAEPYILDLFFNFLPCRVSLHFFYCYCLLAMIKIVTTKILKSPTLHWSVPRWLGRSSSWRSTPRRPRSRSPDRGPPRRTLQVNVAGQLLQNKDGLYPLPPKDVSEKKSQWIEWFKFQNPSEDMIAWCLHTTMAFVELFCAGRGGSTISHYLSFRANVSQILLPLAAAATDGNVLTFFTLFFQTKGSTFYEESKVEVTNCKFNS